MQGKSPYKVLRNAKRIARYNEMKRIKYFSNFSTKLLSLIEIPPAPQRILTMSRPTLVDIPPDQKKPKLSFARQTCVSISPIYQPSQTSTQPPTPSANRWMSPPGPDLEEIDRQLNVRNTLQMIDDALNLLNR